MSGKRFDIGIDHPMISEAKAALDQCMQLAVARAIETGSNEGSAALRISFTITTVMDEDSGELQRLPEWKYKAGFNVPMKESVEATIRESSKLVERGGSWKLMNGQIHMDELLTEDEDE